MNLSNIKSITISEGNVTKITNINDIIYWEKEVPPTPPPPPIPPPKPIQPIQKPLYLHNLANVDAQMGFDTTNYDGKGGYSLDYSIDEGVTWNSFDFRNKITIKPNKKLYLKGNIFRLQEGWGGWASLTSNNTFSVGGDLTSIFKEGGNLLDSSERHFLFFRLFYRQYNLLHAKDLYIPIEVGDYCIFREMFNECYNLIDAPEINVTSINDTVGHSDGLEIFSYMFAECHSLIKPPSCIKLETMPYRVPRDMFKNCINLTESPIFYCTNTETLGFLRTFEGCTSLKKVSIPNLKNWSDTSNSWLLSASSSGTIIKPASLVLPTNSISGIPSGWTTQDSGK